MAGSSLVVANFKTGYETDREPFLVGNDAFPIINNAFIFRGRIRKKRGTLQLGRLTRTLTDTSIGSTPGATWTFNLFTVLGLNVTESAASVVPSPVTGLQILTITAGTDTFVDQGNGTLRRQDGNLTSTINYATGAITLHLLVAGATPAFVSFSYYPDLPAMGIENFETNIVNFPTVVFFDTRYSYFFNQSTKVFYSVNFYATTVTPFVWSGQSFQQFWTTNYQGAMWATNGNPGFHFKNIVSITPGNPTSVQVTAHGLITGDYVFFYEVIQTVKGNNFINGFSGQVTVVDANNFTVALDTAGATFTNPSGIIQTLTNSGGASGDGIRWFDGDPTQPGSILGWVNFAPPLISILPTSSNTEPGPYAGVITYLVGAEIIIPFKNSLLVFGASTQTSTGAAQFFPNLLVFSQTGTPYYSFPVPTNQTADPLAWVADIPNHGGDLTAPIDQEIVTVGENADALLVGFETKQLVLFFTGDTSLPFQFQTINSELGSQSTFSGINLDMGTITIGDYGLALTTQTSVQRIDLVIPDQVFEITAANNGSNRVTAARDYRNELIYFTYPPFNRNWIFPSRTLLYNYRDDSWATFDENYTHYGTFRFTNAETWATPLAPSWETWDLTWNFGASAPRYPFIAAGNQQGFIMLRTEDTNESPSQFIQNIVGAAVTSPNHCLNDGDWIVISGLIGGVLLDEFGSALPANTPIQIAVDDTQLNSFTLLAVSFSGTYLGGGVYQRLTNIFIQSKQFPIFWEGGRQARIGTQRFLFTATSDGEVTVDVYSSQNNSDPDNDPSDAFLIFTNKVLTSAEPSNPFAAFQNQIWHRMSNSFNGETVQIGFRLSDDQMADLGLATSEIELHALAMDLYPGPILV